MRGTDFTSPHEREELHKAVDNIIDNINKEQKIINQEEAKTVQHDALLNVLNFCKALVVQIKWMILLKENENISHKGWTHNAENNIYKLMLVGKDTATQLEVMRKVIFKAAICCEAFFENNAPNARTADLAIIDTTQDGG